MMSYQNKNIQQTNSGNNSVSEAQTARNGISFPAVSALQMQGAEEELQMKKFIAILIAAAFAASAGSVFAQAKDQKKAAPAPKPVPKPVVPPPAAKAPPRN